MYGYSNHVKENCRFLRYKCKLCNEKGHLNKMCPKKVKQNHYLGSDVSCDMEGKCPFFNIRRKDSLPFMQNVDLSGKIINCEIDSGSSISAMSEQYYLYHFKSRNLTPSEISLRTYDGGLIKPIGKFTLPASYGLKTGK